ncbi:heterogeneous nuclear ribonucleoprotein A0 [Trifolium repens]|nr:heterogeneous nuclear ribonucleoprotein A0 [Trifolium repens]
MRERERGRTGNRGYRHRSSSSLHTRVDGRRYLSGRRQHRPSSPAWRANWVGRVPGRVPEIGGDGGDWIDMMPRRRKVIQHVDRGQDRLRRRSRSNSGSRQVQVRNYSYCETQLDGRRKGYACRDGSVREGSRIGVSCDGRWQPRVGRDGYAVRRGIEGAVLNDGEQFGFKSSDNFYFTNFPEQISHFYLKKAFEVCGILEKVYVAKKRNVHGQKYGFVRFSNVKNVSKLLIAINDIHFGQFRIWARVARFDKPPVGMDGMGHEWGGTKREKAKATTAGEGENIVSREKQGAVLENAAVGERERGCSRKES